MKNEVELIKTESNNVKTLFQKVAQIIPSFHLTDPKILPYGLKPHTRSASWIVEQVIKQQIRTTLPPWKNSTCNTQPIPNTV